MRSIFSINHDLAQSPHEIIIGQYNEFIGIVQSREAGRTAKLHNARLARSPPPSQKSPSSAAMHADWRQEIVTRSACMESILAEAKLVAASDTSVLIHGETGTGKELLARAIHKASNRANRPFIAINCAAISESLLDAELFGHCKGAFSSALHDNKGLIRKAHKGTLFLDGIGDISVAFQLKLLSMLQERAVRPLGSPKIVPVDVRIISATHVDLDKAIRSGVYRKDLYYRLNVVDLRLPSLAQRRDDIPLLATHFIHQLTLGRDNEPRTLSAGALECLAEASWPGNVRQLYNVITKIVLLSTSGVITDQQVKRALASNTYSGNTKA